MTTASLDKFQVAQIRALCVVDSASRVTWRKEPLEVYVINGERKVVLPGTKITVSVAELVENGATLLGSLGPQTKQADGGRARWADSLEARRAAGVPPNVYRANQRSVDYALAKGKAPPPPTWVGRRQRKCTEVYDTVDEVVAAMNEGRWRTEFAKGRHARRKR